MQTEKYKAYHENVPNYEPPPELIVASFFAINFLPGIYVHQ